MNEPRKPSSIRAETVPDLTTMTPAEAWSAWRRWLADHYPLPKTPGYIKADAAMAGALREYELNFGKQAEEVSRKNLADKLATFDEAYSNR